jgi:hypothetical protein
VIKDAVNIMRLVEDLNSDNLYSRPGCMFYWRLSWYPRMQQSLTCYYILSFIFPSNTTIYQLTHISLCIIEFIGRTMPLYVSAHGAIFRWYINNLILLNYVFLWIHVLYLSLCVTITWGNIVCFSHFCLITVICTDCILYCFKNVLNKYLNLLKVLKH